MLSVAESAAILKVSPARVRALIAKGALPAEKAGRAWLLREEDVMQRLSQHAKAGRPRGANEHRQTYANREQSKDRARFYKLYHSCKEAFRFCPDANLFANAESSEEAAFYATVADFFLQQRQKQVVNRGVY